MQLIRELGTVPKYFEVELNFYGTVKKFEYLPDSLLTKNQEPYHF
jgi:hypothetical protein